MASPVIPTIDTSPLLLLLYLGPCIQKPIARNFSRSVTACARRNPSIDLNAEIKKFLENPVAEDRLKECIGHFLNPELRPQFYPLASGFNRRFFNLENTIRTFSSLRSNIVIPEDIESEQKQVMHSLYTMFAKMPELHRPKVSRATRSPTMGFER